MAATCNFVTIADYTAFKRQSICNTISGAIVGVGLKDSHHHGRNGSHEGHDLQACKPVVLLLKIVLNLDASN